MSANGWLKDGADSAKDFDAYDGGVTFAKVEHLLYVQLLDFGSMSEMTLPVKSKEALRMAHWIIKEFG